MKSEKNKCLICNESMNYELGTIVDSNDGVTTWCDNKECKMADWGHGKDEKSAFEIFSQKCGK